MVALNKSHSLFDLGRTLATPGALAALEQAHVSPASLLSRHASGDWGTLCDEDKQANDHALISGGRILSAYVLPTKVKLWIITEATDDQGRRAATTLLLPEEY
jgi:hypothetical protein